jgi:hypothetical protein
MQHRDVPATWRSYLTLGAVVLGMGLGCGDDASSGVPDAAPGLDADVTSDVGIDPHVDLDGDGFSPADGDCDDADPLVHPGAREVCDDGIDNNCNGAVDVHEPDADSDGFGPCQGDCDDTDPLIGPHRPEIAGNGVDDDCDGRVDVDLDGDGYAEADGDCDDADPHVNPGQVENCWDGVDNNCNGAVDQDEPDGDGDGVGPCQGDCDDTDPLIGPHRPEIAGNGIDDNCDFLVDEDVDGDGWTEANGDCNDQDPTMNPGALEICDDGKDNDCDGVVDTDCFDPCRPNDDVVGPVPCTAEAPPDSFEPAIQWTWTGSGGEVYSIVTPLVANLTDDNADGVIDLCDTPDVVVVASTSSGAPSSVGHIYLLDGLTGTQALRIPTDVDATVTPAIGDLDDDGIPEIVTITAAGYPVAFHHDGSVLWTGTVAWPERYSGAIALADLDNDGDVEIIAGNRLYDHQGVHLWTAPQPAGDWSATTAADLDGDGDLEVILGHAAYHHDGSQHYLNAAVLPGYPQVANLDADPEPEVLVTNRNGITVLNHDGTVVYADQRPTGVAGGGFTTWLRPATIHDFDGDGQPEYASSCASAYVVYETNASIVWQAVVSDQSGIAAGTAFDFLGDGTAEAMYADEYSLFIFGGAGQVLLQTPRTSGTLSEYPVVADIDNDGSAEIVVVSNSLGGAPASPTVQVIRDVQDRWIQARRIWNQHTYHVTNVREDGTIPQFEAPAWQHLNTFRTNAQIENGGVCSPLL